MRICTPQLGIAPNATLGGEVHDREILTHLAALGAEIELILPAGLPYPTDVPWRVTRVPLRRGYRWPVSNLIFVPYIGLAYRRQPFDLLRVHSLRFTGLAALWARRVFHLPVPIVAHHHHIDRDRWTQPIDGRVVRQVEHTITGSEFARHQLVAETGVPLARVSVVYYGISASHQPRAAHQYARDVADAPKLLLHVGSLIARKNLSVLLQAFQQVTATVSNVRLALVGRGPLEPALRREAQQLGIADRVDFLGFVTEAEKLALYHRAALVVSASKMEGFGLAVGEAMACAVPVVATNVGSLPELVVDGESGLLVPVDDPAALRAAIVRVLNDPGLAASMAAAGAERVTRYFRWPLAARGVLDVYQRVLAG